MRVLVCGSRNWQDINPIRWALTRLDAENPQCILIHGTAHGADQQAAYVAHRLGWPIDRYPADWDKYGRAAGAIRNQQMLEEGEPDLVLAFWDGESKGTRNMISIAKKAGIKVTILHSSDFTEEPAT